MKCHFLLLIIYISIFFLYFLTAVVSTINPEDCGNGNGNGNGNGKIRTAGTGTVLFNPTDVYKTCWSQEEIAILTARLVLEDVIPDPKMISIQCNEDVDDLIEYFKAVIDTIRSNTKARKRHIMLMALTDLLGGYLHHAILPKARGAYYAGAVDYAYMEKLIQLYEELKWFLRTNGQGWTKPMAHTKELRVPPIQLDQNEPKKANDSCCHKLLFYEHEPVKTRKRAVSTEKGIYFPLPFFDAKYRPTSIVVPLKRFALRNIESKRSAYVIMKYFLSAEKCLKEKNAKPDMIQRFQNNLLTWIDKEVIPKLNDDKFYSAFGGILRIQTTLKGLGAKIGPATCNTDEGEEEVGAVPAVGCTSRRNKILLIAMLIVIVAWFFIGTCFICYRMKNSKSKRDKLDGTKTSKPGSSASFSSSRWSSIISRSSSKTSKSHKQMCKCCESTISEKSTAGYTSTSEYDSEKTQKKEKRKKPFGASNKKMSQSSPCVCPNDGPAVIDTKHSIKVLPSIAEMSENSLSKGKNGSLKKISFAEESGISSSDGGIRPCAPPWAQTNDTVPCPRLTDKSTNYSTSRSTTAKSQALNDFNITDIPMASSTKYETSIQQSVSQSNRTNGPLANSTFRNHATETSNEYETSNSPGQESYQKDSNKSITTKHSSTPSIEEYAYIDEEEKPPDIKKEPGDKTYYDYHTSACHSSISGNYNLFSKQDTNKPYIFGYDFQTSTSSEVSEDDDSKY